MATKTPTQLLLDEIGSYSSAENPDWLFGKLVPWLSENPEALDGFSAEIESILDNFRYFWDWYLSGDGPIHDPDAGEEWPEMVKYFARGRDQLIEVVCRASRNKAFCEELKESKCDPYCQ